MPQSWFHRVSSKFDVINDDQHIISKNNDNQFSQIAIKWSKTILTEGLRNLPGTKYRIKDRKTIIRNICACCDC